MIYRHQKQSVRTDVIATRPTNVLNLALRVFEDRDGVSEDAQNEKITELTNANQEVFEECGACRVSVLICRRATYLMYVPL